MKTAIEVIKYVNDGIGCEERERRMAECLAAVRRKTLLAAASEVARHWNDRATMIVQYRQAQMSAGILQQQAIAEPANSEIRRVASNPAPPNL